MGSSTTVIGGEYLVLGKIGEGSFGEVFRATHIATGVDYAIKREPANVAHPQLEHEARIYEDLAGGVGIANMHWFGQEGMYNAMVIDLLGPNLKQVRRENEKLPLSFVIELGVQMITQLEYIHKKGFVYRDIKPENFLLDAEIDLPDAPLQLGICGTSCANSATGTTPKSHTPPTSLDQIMRFFNDTRQRQYSLDSDMSTSPVSPIKANYGKPTLSIVDFGLVTRYRDPVTGRHIPNKGSTKHKVGTARYASINIHCGREHTRRDDIESVGYMLLEFLIGTLPWSGISARNSRQGWAKMKEIKEDIELNELCEGLPRGFMSFVGYSRGLRFDEEPDYEYLRNILWSSAGRGAEAQTVRCYRDPSIVNISNTARPLEHGVSGGLLIHRNDPFKSKEKTKENPLKDWRTRPQYSPPHKERQQQYSPNSLWTTTPPDVTGSGPKDGQLFGDVHQDAKDKIEWDATVEPYPDTETDRSSSMWGEDTNQDGQTKSQGQRKCSWGEDDPNSRWGHDDCGDTFMPFQMGSFKDEATLTPSTVYAKVAGGTGFGRQYAPQDARFYSSDPPVGLTPRLGNGSGFIPAQPALVKAGVRNGVLQTLPSSIHPLSKNTAKPAHPSSGSSLSPTSLSSSFSSLSVRSGVYEGPGIERSQVSGNRGSLSDMDKTTAIAPTTPTAAISAWKNTSSSSRGRKISNQQDPIGHGGEHGIGGGGGFQSHGKGVSRKGSSSEIWQQDGRHGNGNGNGYGNGCGNGNGNAGGQPRSGRRHHHVSSGTSLESPTFKDAGTMGSFEPHLRLASAPGTRMQYGQPLQSPKQGGGGFQDQVQVQGQGQGYRDQSRAQGHAPFVTTLPPPIPGPGPGFGEHRRQSRARKSSNASLSSLPDSGCHWGASRFGDGESTRARPKY